MNMRKCFSILATLVFALFAAALVLPAHAQTTFVSGVVGANLNLRAEPTTASGVITVVPYGTVIQATETDPARSWLGVVYQGSFGWLSLTYIDDISGDINALPVTERVAFEEPSPVLPDGIRVTVPAGTTLWATFAETEVIGSVPDAALVATAISPEGDWLVVTDGLTFGWVSRSFVTEVSGQLIDLPTSTTIYAAPNTEAADEITAAMVDGALPVAVGDFSLNLRSGPSTDDTRIITVIPAGADAQAVAISADTNWLQITYNGFIGWVSRSFVTVLDGQLIDLPTGS